jgi:hypothetical protein
MLLIQGFLLVVHIFIKTLKSNLIFLHKKVYEALKLNVARRQRSSEWP